MKNEKKSVCPGCHHHCPMGAPRCKYGRSFFARQEARTIAEPQAVKVQPKRKWEAYVSADGLAWRTITAGRSLKKALCHGCYAEKRLEELFSAEEREQLSALLARLHGAVCASCPQKICE